MCYLFLYSALYLTSRDLVLSRKFVCQGTLNLDQETVTDFYGELFKGRGNPVKRFAQRHNSELAEMPTF